MSASFTLRRPELLGTIGWAYAYFRAWAIAIYLFEYNYWRMWNEWYIWYRRAQ